MKRLLLWVHRLIQVMFYPALLFCVLTALFDLGRTLTTGGGDFGGIWFYVVAIIGTPTFLILYFVLRFLNKTYPNNVSGIFYVQLPAVFIILTFTGYAGISIANSLLDIPQRILWLRSDGEFFLFLSLSVGTVLTSPYLYQRYTSTHNRTTLVTYVLFSMILFTVAFMCFEPLLP